MADHSIPARTRVFVVPWRPRTGRSRSCENCGLSYARIGKHEFGHPLVGHPWNEAPAAWWCIACLRAAGYAPETMEGTKPFPQTSWIHDSQGKPFPRPSWSK